jgi:hypothetical protein
MGRNIDTTPNGVGNRPDLGHSTLGPVGPYECRGLQHTLMIISWLSLRNVGG